MSGYDKIYDEPWRKNLRDLAQNVLGSREEDSEFSSSTVSVNLSPEEVVNRIKSFGLESLLPLAGTDLSHVTPNDYWPDLNLIVGEATHYATELNAWHREDRPEIIRNGNFANPSRLDIMLWFTNGEHQAAHRIRYRTDQSDPALPHFHIDVVSPSYRGTGVPDSYNFQAVPSYGQEEIDRFISLARDLYDNSRSVDEAVLSSDI